VLNRIFRALLFHRQVSIIVFSADTLCSCLCLFISLSFQFFPVHYFCRRIQAYCWAFFFYKMHIHTCSSLYYVLYFNLFSGCFSCICVQIASLQVGRGLKELWKYLLNTDRKLLFRWYTAVTFIVKEMHQVSLIILFRCSNT